MDFQFFSTESATPVEVLVMPRKWIPWNDECGDCGSDACEVFTVSDVGAYDGDEVRCLDCEQTGYVSADETGCHTVWRETVLPELTDEERDAMNSYPADAVSHWCKGEIWDGNKWITPADHQLRVVNGFFLAEDNNEPPQLWVWRGTPGDETAEPWQRVADADDTADIVANLGMLVARLVQQVRKYDPANDVAEKAIGYLRRKEFPVSILRAMERQ